MRRSSELAISGAWATAVAFGPARIGYGLFLPKFRELFGLSQSNAGLIASTAFAGFFVALLFTGMLVARRGARLPVVLGSITALAGFVLVAFAESVTVLALGVVLAATSAGFCWTPFNDAVEQAVDEARHARTLSIVSTGTTVGIACSGALAIAVAGSSHGWRAVWVLFAVAALVSALGNGWALRRLRAPAQHATTRKLTWSAWARPALPLYAIAGSFGITNSIYLSFAVDRVSHSGGLPGLAAELAGPVLYVAFGFGGLFGLLTADIKQRTGLPALVRFILICSCVSVGLIGGWPTAWWSVLLSAALQGLCVMVLSAIFSFWSESLYPSKPTLGFTVVLSLFAAGNIIGPVLAGYSATAFGPAPMFFATAAVSLITAVLFPSRVRQR
ncbi:MFS transporter [Salinisphaera hydrothermalis]|uniref:MFS transporter n=1 Tax=Salinisphaera hydrothermalis TaxID=563188 RepID=UPI00333F48D4